MEFYILTETGEFLEEKRGRIGNHRIDTGRAKRRNGGRKSRRRRAIRQRRRLCLTIAFALTAGVFLYGKTLVPAIFQFGGDRVRGFLSSVTREDYPEELLDLLEKNQETYDFVANYPQRQQYIDQEVDLSGICQKGEIPLLLQWDLRWGYDNYGDSMIGLAGCGPTCMSMAYLGLTGDTDMTPRRMAEYAAEHGYHSEAGTSWSFFTQGADGLGLFGKEIPLSESAMKQAIDQGSVIICSMRPGDFTTTGHFILLKGYDETGFFVNDPNSRRNSEKQWDYDTLSGQIKGLWEIGT